MQVPCPTCQKPMGERLQVALKGPRVPKNMGPFRKAALEEAQDGMCVMCDDRPLKLGFKTRRYGYTCGEEPCQRAWRNLCAQDWHYHERQSAHPGVPDPDDIEDEDGDSGDVGGKAP